MPRKIHRKKNKMNLIATKLIQISLKVDDLIYKNRPIPLEDARSYLREISEYKEICQKDPRSLQVIEKLSRIMIGIIDDNSEPDEKSNDNLNLPFDNNMDVDMQKAISSLSINEIHEPQSILTNVSLNTDCATQPITINDDEQNYKMENNETTTKKIQTVTCGTKQKKTQTTKEKKVVKKRAQKRNFKAPHKESDNIIIQLQTVSETAIDQTNNVSLENNSNMDNEKTNSEDQPPKQISRKIKSKSTQHPIKQNKRKIVTKKKKPIPEIYSRSIENDLSWFENIRYVREITNDENDPQLSNLGVGFWDNLETPHLFDQHDFDN